MQRKPEGPPNRRPPSNDRDFFLITATFAVFGIFIGIICFSVVQCGSAAYVAHKHEENIIEICQGVELSLYTACLRREWDRIHEENK